MKIVVIDGTGLIGSKNVAILRQGGHEVVPASPRNGINSITGEGLKDRAVQEMALVAEIACVLTVSEHAAGAFMSECQALTTVLPLTLEALQAGTISWAHARIMVDETSNLDPAGAAALEAHRSAPRFR